MESLFFKYFSFARVGGRIADTTVAVGNVGAGEDTLIELSIPANTLSLENDGVAYRTALTFEANGNAKRVRLYIGNTGSLSLIYDSTALAQSGGNMCIDVFAIRTSLSTELEVRAVVSNISGSLFADTTAFVILGLAFGVGNQIDIRITGEAVANNDIINRFATLNWEPAAP